jgi:hypothetical protein
VVFGHLLAQAFEALERGVRHDHFRLSVFECACCAHASAPQNNAIILFLQKVHNRAYLFRLPHSKSDVILFLILAAADKIETGQRKGPRQVFEQGYGFEFGGRIAVQVQDDPLVGVLRFQNGELYFFACMEDRFLDSAPCNLIVSEVFGACIK